MVAPYVQKLKEASTARLATDEGFKLVADDIKTYKDGELERSRISLKEKSAKEKAADKAKVEKRNGGKSKNKGDSGDDDTEVPIVDDYMLQEALRVTADYTALRSGKGMAKLTIPEVVKAEKKRQAHDKKALKPKS